MEVQAKFNKYPFNFWTHTAVKIFRYLCFSPSAFVYGLKFFGCEDNKCSKALEFYYNFKYEDAKFITSELLGSPFVNNADKSKTLNRILR